MVEEQAGRWGEAAQHRDGVSDASASPFKVLEAGYFESVQVFVCTRQETKISDY
jgi:hypothetical protein